MRLIYCVIWLLVLLFGIAFGVLNSEIVQIDYYTHTTQMFLPLLLVIAIAVGVILGWLALSPKIIRQRRNIKRLRRQLKKAERELSDVPRAASYESD